MQSVAFLFFLLLHPCLNILAGIIQSALNRIHGTFHHFRNPLYLQAVKIVSHHCCPLQFRQFLDNSPDNLCGCLLLCGKLRHDICVIIFQRIKQPLCLFCQ